MPDRYTDRAHRALTIAQDEACNLGHAHIGSGHLLLGLIGEDGGVAAQALKALGNSSEMLLDARRLVSRTQDQAPARTGETPTCTPRLSVVLMEAYQEALRLGDNYVATEHLLLGLVAASPLGASPLVAIGINPDEARAKVTELLRGYEAAATPTTNDTASAALEEIRGRGYENGARGARAARLSDDAAIDVPLLLAVADVVLKLHGSAPWYAPADGCEHPEPPEDSAGRDDWDVEHPYGTSGERICLQEQIASYCPACTNLLYGDEPSEYVPAPCATRETITRALTGEGNDGG